MVYLPISIYDPFTESKREYFTRFLNAIGDISANYCPKCHELYGCGHDHDVDFTDFGKCSICGKLDDVVNCTIANEVVSQNIHPFDYCRSGFARIARYDSDLEYLPRC